MSLYQLELPSIHDVTDCHTQTTSLLGYTFDEFDCVTERHSDAAVIAISSSHILIGWTIFLETPPTQVMLIGVYWYKH